MTIQWGNLHKILGTWLGLSLDYDQFYDGTIISNQCFFYFTCIEVPEFDATILGACDDHITSQL
jgi:hypothetical protein